MIVTLLGGIGLFLLGMILMTDGLKALAGDSLRQLLGRYAGGPISGLLAGAGLTVLVQSSHATTLTTIGFVSSGLLSFQQAIGVILGANLGTTSTGWLVALLGFKFNIARMAFVFIGVGALMKLLGRDRVASAGLVAAGFGLIFVGIDTLQLGMTALSDRIDPSRLPGSGLLGRLLLVLFGIVMTVIMQSSSAAIATTLTALNAGNLRLDQAAALVVGQNIGSAITAAIAAIGAGVPAKRTAYTHILFNVFTGAAAFLVLPVFVRVIDAFADRWGGGNDEIALAAFHTMFNVLGVAIFLPCTHQFARLITRIVPDRGPMLTRHLGPLVSREPQAAVEAVHVTLVGVLEAQTRYARQLLQENPPRNLAEDRAAIGDALAKSSEFLGHLPAVAQGESAQERRLAVVHALDHLLSLNQALGEAPNARVARERPELRSDLERVDAALAKVLVDLEQRHHAAIAGTFTSMSKELAETRRSRRQAVLAATAAGAHSPDEALRQLDAIRWFDRVGFHAWRASAHLFEGSTEVVQAGG